MYELDVLQASQIDNAEFQVLFHCALDLNSVNASSSSHAARHTGQVLARAVRHDLEVPDNKLTP